jgi:dipeptidyl aminopeptidase/acylaminoacyl peptidase
MTIEQRLERDLPDILGDLGVAPYPDYIDDVLLTTARRGQRPRWMFPERWLPVELATTRVPATRMPWRQLGVLALIAVLLATAVAVYIGATTPHLPPPFGPARNGRILFVHDGQVYVSDTLASTPKLLIGGGGGIGALEVSRDGRRISYVDDAYKGGFDLFVASIDGTGSQKLNDDPLFDIERIVWSPDGSMIAVSHRMWNTSVISVFATDGSGGRLLDTGGLLADGPDWRPSDPKTLSFRGEKDDQVDVYLMDPDGSNLRPLGIPHDTPTAGDALFRPNWSPDGTRIAYHSNDVMDPAAGLASWRTHVFNVATRQAITLSSTTLLDQHDTEPVWSPDGTKILTQRFVFGKSAWMAVLPADGSGPGVDLDLRSTEYPPSGWRGQFSPDGSLVIAYYDYTGEAVTFDPLTGTSTPMPWTVSDVPTFQRIARN